MKREIEKFIEENEGLSIYFRDKNMISRLIKHSYNLGLQDAVDNVKIINSTVFQYSMVDRESILKLKL